MNNSFQRIKKKFDDFESKRYWGDDFDVRYYLISQLKEKENRMILDVGGGIGIISSELKNSNFTVNLDLSFNDLKLCNENFSSSINTLNGSMTDLPLRDNSFDMVICSHILEIAKGIDLKNNTVVNNENKQYPTIDKILKEIKRVLKNNGIVYVTTPNNAYYKSSKLTYLELKDSIKRYFKEYSIYFYNTYPSLSKKYRKLNFANTVPKVKLKFQDHTKIINSLLKNDNDEEQTSVSFYVEIRK